MIGRIEEKKEEFNDYEIVMIVKGLIECPESLNRRLITWFLQKFMAKVKQDPAGVDLKHLLALVFDLSSFQDLEIFVNKKLFDGLILSLVSFIENRKDRIPFLQYQDILTSINRLHDIHKKDLFEVKDRVKAFLNSHSSKDSLKDYEPKILLFLNGFRNGYSAQFDLQEVLRLVDSNTDSWGFKLLFPIMKITLCKENTEDIKKTEKRLNIIYQKINKLLNTKLRNYIIYEYYHQFSNQTFLRECIEIDPQDLEKSSSFFKPHTESLFDVNSTMKNQYIISELFIVLIEHDQESWKAPLKKFLDSLAPLPFSNILLKILDFYHVTTTLANGNISSSNNFMRFILSSIEENMDKIISQGLITRILRFLISVDANRFKEKDQPMPELVSLIKSINEKISSANQKEVRSINIEMVRRMHMRLLSWDLADEVQFVRELAIKITQRSIEDFDIFSMIEHFGFLLEIDQEISRSFARSEIVVKRLGEVKAMLGVGNMRSLSTLNRVIRLVLFVHEDAPTLIKKKEKIEEQNSVMWILKNKKRKTESKMLTKEDTLEMLEAIKDEVIFFQIANKELISKTRREILHLELGDDKQEPNKPSHLLKICSPFVRRGISKSLHHFPGNPS